MTVTQIRTAEPLHAVPAPREAPPLRTHMTLNLHVNSDTTIRAARRELTTGEEYLSVEFVDPTTNYGGVTVFLSDTDVIRLIDALQSTYPAAS